MKKLFTLIVSLMAFGAANAATIDDVQVCKHSYVLVMDEATNNGSAKPGKGQLFGDGFFLDVTGGSVATNKGKVNLAVADSVLVTPEIAAKYGEYGEHMNSFRLKKDQDVMAMKVTAGSKLIIFFQCNNKEDRYPIFGTEAKVSSSKIENQGTMSPIVNSCRRMEWTADDDRTIYIGDNNGDMFVSYVIVEANEADGTPSVKVGAQTYENGLYFKEVTCKTVAMSDGTPTIAVYTTDGSTPTAASPVYKEPIKCYQDMTVKFQAFMDMGDGVAYEGCEAPGADNDGIVSFSFNAPKINADGANVTIVSEYEGAKNYYSYGDIADQEGNEFTLEESATVTAYSKIVNGSYATFTTKTTTADVYVLNPIKEAKTIAIAGGEAVYNEESQAYTIENGALTEYDKKDFFIKNLTFAAVPSAEAAGVAQFQVPAGQEAYIQMSNTNISFFIEEGDSVDVTVTCSKNSCKTLNIDNDESVTTDRQCKVNVSGTVYGDTLRFDEQGNFIEGNVIKFGLAGGKVYTFQKFSGTGNILISSIEFAPAAAAGLKGDANNDGAVDVADITAIASYILGEVPTGFNSDNADVNGDSVIDVADITGTAAIILGTGAAE